MNSGLNLSMLAEKIGTTRHNISQVINEHFGMSFFRFVNKYRIDETILFKTLNKDNILKIVDLEVNHIIDRIGKLGYTAKISKDSRVFIADEGYDKKNGVRPLKRAIQDKVEDLLSEEVLTGKMVEGKTYNIKVDNDEIKISKKGK